MSILIDFVNLKSMEMDNVSGLYKKYSISHTLQGDADGREHFATSKHDEGRRFYFESFEDAKKQKEELSKVVPCDWIVLPDDPQYKELSVQLKSSQYEFRDFLDECIRGNLDLSYINSLMEDKERSTKSGYTYADRRVTRAFFIPTLNQWAPHLDLEIRCSTSLEDYISAYGIIFPLLRGEGELFSKTKRCLQCGEYFFAKSLKAVFCSDVCRKNYHREGKEAAL